MPMYATDRQTGVCLTVTLFCDISGLGGGMPSTECHSRVVDRLSNVITRNNISLSVAYIRPKSRTERPRKTKIGTEVAQTRIIA